MKSWKEKTFGTLIACGQRDSRRGAVLCVLLLQTPGPAAFTALCGRNVLRAPVSSQEGPTGTHQSQSASVLSDW